MNHMAKIRVYNVKHGDFILFGLDNNIVVTRDFGSLDSYVNKCINYQIEHCMRCCKLHFFLCILGRDFGHCCHHEAILTHPHSDHYSGYQILYNQGFRKVYDRAYVPYLDFETRDSEHSFHSLQLKTALCFMATMPRSKTHKVHEWITVAPLMSSLSKELIGVHQSCNAFSHWKPIGNVLWPPLPTDQYYKRRYEKLDNMLRAFSDNVRDYIEPIYDELSFILNSLFNKKDDFHGYENLEQYNNDYHTTDEESNNDILSKVNTLLDNISEKLSYENNELIEKMYLSFGTLVDDHSIAFSIGSNDKQALFLSDFHDSAMNRMVNFMTANNYSFIKSAHHGTRLGSNLEKHLSSKPKTDIVVHCCGPSKNPNYRGPLPRYSKLAKDIYCTDWKYHSAKWTLVPNYKLFNQLYKDFKI